MPTNFKALFGTSRATHRSAHPGARPHPAIGDAIAMDDWLRRDVGLPPRVRHREPGLHHRL